jgi:hypothetical protein
MTGSSHRHPGCLLHRAALLVSCAAALALTALPAYSQHAATGGHFGGGAHSAVRAPGARIAAPSQTLQQPVLGANGNRRVGEGTGRGGPFRSGRSGFFRNRYWPYGGFLPWWGWASTWWPDCDFGWTCNDEWAPDNYAESYEEPPRPSIIVYLRDGSAYGALDYWLSAGVFHIETTYGTEKTFPLAQVDMPRTVNENSANGITVTIYSYPSPSDNGAMFIPEAYAPSCPDSPAAPSGPVATPQPAANAASASWFGASGTASGQGLSVQSVRSNSPAAVIGLQPSDVLLRIDCHPIHSAQDIDSAVSAARGTVWVSYLIRGAWRTDKQLALR